MLRKVELQKLINMSRILFIWIVFLMGMIGNLLGDKETVSGFYIDFSL